MEEAHAATASISRTHSQCQRGARAPRIRGRSREDLVFIPGNLEGPPSRFALWRAAFAEKLKGSPAEAAQAAKAGGAYRDRTDDLKLAKLALSQLSYGPERMFTMFALARAALSNGGPRRS